VTATRPASARPAPRSAKVAASVIPTLGTAVRSRSAVVLPKPALAVPPAAHSPPSQGMSLYDATGARKYLTAEERDVFLRIADRADRQVRTLCMTLAYAGCRLSEALALTADRIDLSAGVLVFESLKKRRTGIYRAVPVPPALLDTINMVHGIREAQARRDKGRDIRLWPWSRMTGWRAVHAIMAEAGIAGPHASPKGLRHGFGVTAVSAGIPLNLVQKWLGHAQLSTTAIYANAVGAEEQDIASKMWG
jgi:integrase/recombinase XerD